LVVLVILKADELRWFDLFSVCRAETGSDKISSDPPALDDTGEPMSQSTTTTPAASWIQKTPGVIGRDACIRNSRIAVWMLVEAKRLGFSDEELRERYDPPLTQADLETAWAYAAAQAEEIEQAIRDNDISDDDAS
jgi:uncharacterized protein (DUF433 family)